MAEGSRVYGYFPLADELVVTPGASTTRDSPTRRRSREAIPSVYARYAVTTRRPRLPPEREGQQMLLWPLFVTSFVVDDFLGDHDLFGPTTAVVSSASSKTAIGAAFLLAERDGVDVVGLTSPGNVEFVRSLGCYSSVLTYDAVADRPTSPTALHRRGGPQGRHPRRAHPTGRRPPLLDGGRRHPLGRHRRRATAACPDPRPSSCSRRTRSPSAAPSGDGTASRRRWPAPGTGSSPGRTAG